PDLHLQSTSNLCADGLPFLVGLGRLHQTPARAGPPLRGPPMPAAFVDFDKAGRLALHVAAAGHGGGGPALFRNEGRGRFRDVAVSAGLADSAPPPGSGVARALFVDLDHDGDLDLFLATAAGNRPYRNNPDGTFRSLAAQ